MNDFLPFSRLSDSKKDRDSLVEETERTVIQYFQQRRTPSTLDDLMLDLYGFCDSLISGQIKGGQQFEKIFCQPVEFVPEARFFRFPMAPLIQGDDAIPAAQPGHLMFEPLRALGPAVNQNQRFPRPRFQIKRSKPE